LDYDAGVHVERTEVDGGVHQVRVVRKLRHDAVGVTKREFHVVGRAFDVLRDQNVGALLSNAGDARQV
jgi:hypothetical protein